MHETSWAWYITRSAGLIGFLLLYVSIFLGLAIRTPILSKIIKPIYSCRPHCWLSLQALIFILIHGVALLFDKYLNFGLKDVFVPFATSFHPVLIALGIIGFYLMIILVVSSYSRKFIPNGLWRFLHSLNVVLYVFVVIHALYLGTDLKNPIMRNIFLVLNGILIFLFIVNLIFRIFKNIKNTEEVNESGDFCPRPNNQNYEDIRQNSSQVIAEQDSENSGK